MTVPKNKVATKSANIIIRIGDISNWSPFLPTPMTVFIAFLIKILIR